MDPPKQLLGLTLRDSRTMGEYQGSLGASVRAVELRFSGFFQHSLDSRVGVVRCEGLNFGLGV